MISGGDILILSYINNLINKVKIYNIYGSIVTTECCSYFNCTKTSSLPDDTY